MKILSILNSLYFFGTILFCAHAHGDLPPNTNFCIPKQYTIKYQCADGTDAAEPVTLAYGQTYTTPDALTACPGGVKQWWVDDTEQYITSNTTLPYTYINDITLVSGLDTTIDGTTHGYSSKEMTWFVKFPYGTIRGIARCSNESSGAATPYSGPNTEPSDDLGTGTICYCRAIKPERNSGAWVQYLYWYSSASRCSSLCARFCGYYVRLSPEFRTTVLTGE
ncbi:MAG: hypothetical protein IJ560_03685 [Alphaproteobacteria bacterium]|nr:hypothetical protein [Alphaproteobacteria bacterium]